MSDIPKSQQKAVNSYIRRNYDRIEFTVPKGQRDIIREVAASAGESVGMFIRKAIQQRIESLRE